MKGSISLIYGFLLVVGDFLALVLAFVGAYILRVTLDARPLIEQIPARSYMAIFLALIPFWIIIFALLGLYDSNIYERRFSEFGRLFMGSFMGMLFVIGYAYFLNKQIFPAHLVPIYGFVLAFLFLVLFRNIARFGRSLLFRYGVGITNILIVGNTIVTDELLASLVDSSISGYKVVGVISNSSSNKHSHIHRFSSFVEAIQALKSSQIHSIVQTELYPENDKNNEILEFAQAHHIAYRFVPGNSEMFVGKIGVELFRNSIPVVAVHQTALIGWGRIVKRLFDLSIGMVVLVIASPFMAIIAVAIKLFGGKGGIFFRQTRLTRFDQKFQVYKFRTYKAEFNGLTNEESFNKLGKPELLKKFYDNGQKLDYDPRYTKIGLFLRKTSLDELPQLFNIVKGDISLVGPRALIPQELELYAKKHAILSVKSGLTGLAQVSGRNDITFDERRQLDMYYVQNWSFWLDIVILLKTVRVILKGG